MNYDLDEAKSIFSHDKYAVMTGIEIIKVGECYAKCRLAIKDDMHRNALGAVMGGVLFTLADFTFAVASNYNKPCATVTNVSQISCLKSTSSKTIYGESRLIKNGNTLCTYEIDITDDEGELIAVVVTNGVHLPAK